MVTGRPTVCTDELVEEFCSRLVGNDGNKPKSLVKVCNEPDMPDYKTIMRWMADDRPIYEAFRQKYHRAQQQRTDAIFEELRDIAQTPLMGEITVEKETKDGTFTEVRKVDNVERSKLMIYNAQWQLARMAPRKYGEKQTIEVRTIKSFSDLSEEELLALANHAQNTLVGNSIPVAGIEQKKEGIDKE